MHDHDTPISILQLAWNMPRNIVVYLCEVLQQCFSVWELHTLCAKLTETKKLEVPSARSNVFGNSLSHVSSPNMRSLPAFLAFIWASHVSWFSKLEEVSDSAKFKIISRNEGMEPVVIALIRGMVTVGAVA